MPSIGLGREGDSSSARTRQAGCLATYALCNTTRLVRGRDHPRKSKLHLLGFLVREKGVLLLQRHGGRAFQEGERTCGCKTLRKIFSVPSRHIQGRAGFQSQRQQAAIRKENTVVRDVKLQVILRATVVWRVTFAVWRFPARWGIRLAAQQISRNIPGPVGVKE
jgi:hypothetical protein